MWICVYCNEINETKQKQCCFCNCKRKKEDSKMGKRNISAAASAAVVVLGLTTAFLATHGSQKPTDGATESMQNEARTAVADIQAESMPTTSLNAVEQPAANMQPSLSVPTTSTTPLVSATNAVSTLIPNSAQNEKSRSISDGEANLSEESSSKTDSTANNNEEARFEERYVFDDNMDNYLFEYDPIDNENDSNELY